MVLKIIIVALFLGLVASLFTSFGFLMKDKGAGNRNRTWNALTVRVTLTALLLAAIYYGVSSGQLHSQAPWGKQSPVSSPEPLEK